MAAGMMSSGVNSQRGSRAGGRCEHGGTGWMGTEGSSEAAVGAADAAGGTMTTTTSRAGAGVAAAHAAGTTMMTTKTKLSHSLRQRSIRRAKRIGQRP